MGYPSDVTDDDWLLIEKYFERTNKRGAVSIHAKRDIVNAILYVARGGIQWRMLPTDFPPWGTVYDHYRNWCMRGVWQQALDDLTELHRRKQGRDNKPSYGIIDSQSTKTQYASEDRGYDGGKKKLRVEKRHIVVDILGNLLHVKVHAANIHDTKAAGDVFDAVSKKYPSIQAFSVDAGYRGTAVNHVDNEMQLKLYISERITDTFAILPKRWIVERTFAWLGNFRRLAKDFEILTERAENFIRIAMMKITLGAIANV